MKKKIIIAVVGILIIAIIGVIIFNNYQAKKKASIKEDYLYGVSIAPNFNTTTKDKKDYESFISISFHKLRVIEGEEKEWYKKYFSDNEIEDMKQEYYKILLEQATLTSKEVDQIIALFDNYDKEQIKEYINYIGDRLYYQIINQIDRKCPISVKDNITDNKVDITFSIENSKSKTSAVAKINIYFFDKDKNIIDVKENEFVYLSDINKSITKKYEVDNVNEVTYYFTDWH